MAGGFNVQEILGFAPLTKQLKLVKSAVPNPFPAELYNVAPDNRIIGDRAKFTTTTGERHTSILTAYGSVGRARKLRDIGDSAVRLLHTHETISIELTMMESLRAFEEYAQNEGLDWLKYQIAEAGHRSQNTRVTMLASVLHYGQIYQDAQGNLLPSSSGAVETFDFNVPAANKNQFTGTIAQIVIPWSNANANIPLDIKNIKVYQQQKTGLEVTTALYGRNLPTYMSQNSFVIEYLARQDDMRGQLLRDNTIPSGLFGIKNWIPVDTSFFEDQNDVLQEMWNADLVTWMPDIKQEDNMDWWGCWEGSYPVPTRLNVMQNFTDPYANHKRVFGMASWAMPRLDLPSYDVHFVDTFLIGPRNPNVLMPSIVAF